MPLASLAHLLNQPMMGLAGMALWHQPICCTLAVLQRNVCCEQLPPSFADCQLL